MLLKLFRRWTAIAIPLLLLSVSACDRGSRPDLVNTPAPDFTLQDRERTISLSSLRGKVVVLNFWATWCPPCVAEMPSLNAMQQKLDGRVTVLAVSLDESEADYRRFLAEHNIRLLTIRDPAQKSNQLYGTVRYPETYIIDSRGIVRRKFIGPLDWTRPEILDYLAKL